MSSARLALVLVYAWGLRNIPLEEKWYYARSRVGLLWRGG